MSTLILEKQADCTYETSEVTVTVSAPTQFLLKSNDSVNGQIYFNGVLVAKLTSSNPYVAQAVGDYTAMLVGQCKRGRIYTSDMADFPLLDQDVNIQNDCAGSLVPAQAATRVSIVGTENTLNVRVVEQCDQISDYESACASDDGRLIFNRHNYITT